MMKSEQNIKIREYKEEDYFEIEKLLINQWGDSEDEKKFMNSEFIRVAKENNDIYGICYGDILEDTLHLKAVVIKPEHQNKGIGSILVESSIEYAKEKKLKKILAEAVQVYEKMNFKNLMIKYNFKEINRIRGYWGNKYPEYYCIECNKKPCECTNVIIIKEI